MARSPFCKDRTADCADFKESAEKEEQRRGPGNPPGSSKYASSARTADEKVPRAEQHR